MATLRAAAKRNDGRFFIRLGKTLARKPKAQPTDINKATLALRKVNVMFSDNETAGRKPSPPAGRRQRIIEAIPPEADLHREAILADDSDAKELNEMYRKIERDADAVRESGWKVVLRAAEFGKRLNHKKMEFVHGNWEEWCDKHLKFTAHQARKYIELGKRFSAKEIKRLKPHSVRQAFIYSGILREDVGKRPGKTVNGDESACVRKPVHRIMLELNADEESCDPKLLDAIEPLVERWQALKAKQANPTINVPAQVEPIAEDDLNRTHGSDLPTIPFRFEAWGFCDPKLDLYLDNMQFTVEEAQVALEKRGRKPLEDLLAEGYIIGRCTIEFIPVLPAAAPIPEQDSSAEDSA